jgi:hypothetical protein
MSPTDLAFYFGILTGCLFVTMIPYARKKYGEKSIDSFDVDYLITMFLAFSISVFASLFIYQGTGVPQVEDDFRVFIEGVKMGLFDNFWVNEVKKVLGF